MRKSTVRQSKPAGRLAETWPLRYEDVPFGETFGKSENEIYKESVFVGYRYYTTAKKQVRYPFGYGLSYTSFAWSDMVMSEEGDRFTVSCRVKNTGTRVGAEVVQLYVSAPESKVYKPLRELRAFQKVRLAAGEEKEVRLTVNKDALRYFDVQKRAWTMEGGSTALSSVRMQRPSSSNRRSSSKESTTRPIPKTF